MGEATGAGRLLVLDDDPAIAQVLRAMARACGFDTRHHDTVNGFMAELAAWQPTHVALDLGLPGTSSTAVMQQLAAAGCTARVLVCSGAAAADLAAALDTARSLGLEAAGVLPKPFTLAVLRGLLGR